MTPDLQALRGTIRRLEDEVATLRRVADDSERQTAAGANSAALDSQLPSDILVPRPDDVIAYLRTRPALTQIAADMAEALLQEFAGEPSQVVLDLYADPEIDDRYLVFYVRLPEYGDDLAARLEGVAARFHGRGESPDDWILVTTDYVPLAA